MSTSSATVPSIGSLLNLISQAQEIYKQAFRSGFNESDVLPPSLHNLCLTAQQLLSTELRLSLTEIGYGEVPGRENALPSSLTGIFWGICLSLVEFGHQRTVWAYPACEKLVESARAYIQNLLVPLLREYDVVGGTISVEINTDNEYVPPPTDPQQAC